MSDQPVPADPVSANAGAPLKLSLEPLLAGGQTALAPDREASVLKIALSGVVLGWRNAFNEITIRKADDLYACAAGNGNYYDPVPKGAELIQATLSVQFSDAAEPRTVDIVPPHTLTLQNPADAPRILGLLARRGFSAAQKLALAVLLATAACALPDASYADPLTLGDDDELVEGGNPKSEAIQVVGKNARRAEATECHPSLRTICAILVQAAEAATKRAKDNHEIRQIRERFDVTLRKGSTRTAESLTDSITDNVDELSAAEPGKGTAKRGSREKTRAGRAGNPKPEGRRPKEVRNPKTEAIQVVGKNARRTEATECHPGLRTICAILVQAAEAATQRAKDNHEIRQIRERFS